jgi:hypothetical protein
MPEPTRSNYPLSVGSKALEGVNVKRYGRCIRSRLHPFSTNRTRGIELLEAWVGWGCSVHPQKPFDAHLWE